MLQFSNQLKKLRTECELSQEELANQLSSPVKQSPNGKMAKQRLI